MATPETKVSKIKSISYQAACKDSKTHLLNVVFENGDRGNFFHHNKELSDGQGDAEGKYKIGAQHEYTLRPNDNPNYLPLVNFAKAKKTKTKKLPPMKKQISTASDVRCNNTSIAQIKAYLGGGKAKSLDQLKNLKVHFQCSRSLEELAEEFLPKPLNQ